MRSNVATCGPKRPGDSPHRGRRSPGSHREPATRPTRRNGSVHVLLVDDNPAFLSAARQVLQRARPSFAVSSVGSGADAIAFLERRRSFADAPRPEFIVLDFRLPDINAPAVLQWIMAREDLREIPVLVLSQASWAEDEAAAKAAGARAYRVKPSRVSALRDVIVGFWGEHVDAGDDPSG